MSSPRRSLECRASLLALAIASAGASIHVAVEVAVALWQSDGHATPTRCPGSDVAPTRSHGTVTETPSHDAIELRCRAAGAARCELTGVMPFERALEVTASLFGSDVPDYAYLHFSPDHNRVVWTLRAHQAGLTAEVDAFDAGVVEFVAEGVTTN